MNKENICEKMSFESVSICFIHSSKLSWNIQCTSLCSKVNSTLAFLQCLAAHRMLKAKCFNILVRTILEYRCSAWDPNQASQIATIEKIHKRAARFVAGNYTLSE